MNKLYIGNLPMEVDEATVRQLFSEHSLSAADISVKRGGYAFVDFMDQSAADRAIDKLHGYIYSGLPLVVEPSVANKKMSGAVGVRDGGGGSGGGATQLHDEEAGCDLSAGDGVVDGVGGNVSCGFHATTRDPRFPPTLKNGGKMSTSVDQQFAELGLSQEDHDQIFEPEDNPEQPRSSSKIVISGLPLHVRFDNIEPLLSQYGNVQHCDKVNSRDANSQSVHITYETPDQAQQAVNGLNGYEMEGNRLRVEIAEGQGARGRRGRPGGGGRGGGGAPGGPARPTDFPLRLLVQSDMVGAIIGRQGSTIRLITQQSRARVDVHRKDNVGSLEKAITIYGNPDNCTGACKKILEVMQQEANNTNKGEICLKILAHNNLIGRIIGKGGNTIKRIMQETETKITVSSINDINSFNLERIITVKGGIENMARAESQISAKLRQSYENDLQVLAPQSIMFPGLHPMAMMSTGRGGYCGAPPPFPPPIYAPIAGQAGAQQGAGDSQETTYLYIPNNAVGAIIGTKGSHIRNIIRFSGASVKIAPLELEKQPIDPQASAHLERKVTVVGSPEAQWKAQYLIFEKMREEGFVSGSEDVRLTVEIAVASSQVGRIIGKGGQNVRELQRVTGSLIKLPEQPAAAPGSPATSAAPTDADTTVHIVGPFYSVQSAQRRIRAMVAQATAPSRHRRGVAGAGAGAAAGGAAAAAPAAPPAAQ